MTIIVTLWWLFFFSALGLCIGSFLNVIVYRLPLGLDVSKPRWSFCPSCQNRIAWYDNIPVLSYLKLGGRCRNCWSPISPRYAVVELLTAITVILLLDTFFVAHARDGLLDVADLSWRLSEDWPILLAHIVLFTSLLAMSAIDLQFYWVDIRFTHFASIVGLVLHTIWTPHHSAGWHRPYTGTAVVTAAMFVGFAIVWAGLQFRARSHDIDDPPTPDQPAEAPRAGRTDLARTTPAMLPLVVFVLMLIAVGAGELGQSLAPFNLRAGIGIAFFFVVIVYEASHVRESDTDIIEAIESEAPGVRQATLAELAVLLPAIVLGGVSLFLYLRTAGFAAAADDWLHWKPLGGDWRPLLGASTAISGYVVAAAIGWAVRIPANLVLGKEAFATGDIHMMAAAGCVVGWPVVLIGFMLTCFLAVIAWVALLPFKATRAIPLGPWLWLGFLITTVFHRYLTHTQLVRNVIDAADMLFFGNSQNVSIAGLS